MTTILHILNDGPDALSDKIIEAQSVDHRVEVIDLSRDDVSYDAVVERIFAFRRVVSW